MRVPAQLDSLGYTPFNFAFLTGGGPYNFQPQGYAILSATASQRIAIVSLSVSVNGAAIVWQLSEEDGADLIGPVYHAAADPAFIQQGDIDAPVVRAIKGKDILFTSDGVTDAVTVSGWALKEGLSS